MDNIIAIQPQKEELKSKLKKPQALNPNVKHPKHAQEFKLLNKNLEKFLEAFMQNGGNITQAALVAHPNATKQAAANLGSRYLREGKDFIRVLMETKGLTYGKMLDVAEKKMVGAKDPAWWDRIMKLGGYADFIPGKEKAQTPGIVNIIQTQKKLISEYVEGEIVEE